MKRALYSLLPIFMATASVDSPAQESLVKGASATTNNTIFGTGPDQLVATTVVLPQDTGTWQCVVTGSAEAINPLNGDDNRYAFGLNDDNLASTESGSDRTIDFDNLTGEETDRVEVSSTYVFRSLSSSVNINSHTFYWSARKEDGADADMTVDDSSMSVVCSDFE